MKKSVSKATCTTYVQVFSARLIVNFIFIQTDEWEKYIIR